MFRDSEEELKESDSGCLSEIQEEQKEYYDSPEKMYTLTQPDDYSASKKLQFSVDHKKVTSPKKECETEEDEYHEN